MSNVDRFKDRLNRVANQLDDWAKNDCVLKFLTTDPLHDGTIKETLECHVRQFAIDTIMDGLGWRGFSIPTGTLQQFINMSIEVAVRPPGQERRWMDYLGFDGNCRSPLLLVEAKRFCIGLPTAVHHTGPATVHPMAVTIRRFVERLNRGDSLEDSRSGLDLNKEWAEFIETHIDYLRGLQHDALRIPPMSAITNGDWLLTFVQPKDLLTANDSSRAEIRIYSNLQQLRANAEEVFADLSYVRLADRPGPFSIPELVHVLDPRSVIGFTRGVEISYHENFGRQFKSRPSIFVSPIVGLFSEQRKFIFVAHDNPETFFAPTDVTSEEYERLRAASDRLLTNIRAWVGKNAPTLSVEELGLKDPIEFFRELSGLCDGRTFLFVTGTEPYLLNLGKASECVAHTGDARSSWNTNVLPQIIPATEPKVMFRDGDRRICRHEAVRIAKLRAVSIGTQPRAEMDSTRNARAICLLSVLEQFACCRTCVYVNTCGVATGTSLPCGPTGLQ